METNRNRNYCKLLAPTWDAIETALRSLTTESGSTNLNDDRGAGSSVVVAGSPGVYALDVIIDDSRAAMLVSKSSPDDTPVEVYGEEYRADQVVHDIELVVRLVKDLIDSDQFTETSDMKWEYRRI